MELPDLTVVSVSAPANAGAGTAITVSDTVTASSTGENAGSFYVSYYLSADSTITTSDTYLGNRYVSSLAAGASSSANTAVTLPLNITGPYYIGAIVDGGPNGNRVPESDETNNALAGNQITVFGPDLMLTAVSGPSTGCTGGTITVSNTFETHGLLLTPGFEENDWLGVNVAVRLYLSMDTSITTSDDNIGRRNYAPTGGVGADITNTADTPVTIPASFTPGQYYLGGRADGYLDITHCGLGACQYGDTDGSNNVLTGNLITISGPDVVMTAVNGPASVSAGSSITVHDTVATLSGGTAAFDVGFYLSVDNVITSSDMLLGHRMVQSLACGASSTADTTLTIPTNLALGTYYIGAIANDHRSGARLPNEINETNNALAGNQIVLTGPDLVMTAVSTFGTGSIGGTITVSNTVTNQNGTPSAGFHVNMYLSTSPAFNGNGIYLGSRWVSGLAGGASSSEDTNVTIPSYIGDDWDGYPIYLTPGAYYIVVVADPYNVVGESNETNNALAGNQIFIGNDTTPPMGSVLINAGAEATNTTVVTLTLSATDTQNGISQMQFSGDNITWTTPEPYTTTKSWTLSSGDGSKPVWVKFKDVAGNWSAAFNDSIMLDTIAPVVTIASPVALMNYSKTPLLSFIVSDGLVTVKIDGVVSTKRNGDALNALADGQHTVRVEAIDAAGNVGFAEVVFTVRTFQITTTLSSTPPYADGANGWFKTTPIITLASNVSGTTYYEWGSGQYASSRQTREWIGGGTPLNIKGDDIGDWYTLPFSFTFYGTSYSRVFLSINGQMSFVSENVDTYDEAGLSSKVVVIAPLWDDLRTDVRSGDDIYVFQPDADSVGFRWQAVTYGGEQDTNFEVILYRDGRIRFNYGTQQGGLYGVVGISKGDGINYITVYDGDISSTNNIDSVVFARSGWNVYTGPFTALSGENALYYYSSDSSGNSEATKYQIFKVDTTLPIVSITSPLSGFTNNTMPLLSYSLNKAPAAATVTVDGVAVNKSSGDPLGPLPEGLHTVRVAVEDYAGNKAFAEVAFTVVSFAPSVSIASPAAGFTTNNRPLLSYSVNYGTVAVKVDGVAVSKASGNNLDVLADGSHTVRVESLDASGFITFDEVKPVVDTTPPLSSSIPSFISIAAGDRHSIGITVDGTLWQWGATLDESLATSEDSWASVTSPAIISADHSWRSVAAGLSSNLALKTDGTLWAWGTNRDGQLGSGDDTGVDRYAPIQIGTGSGWKAVSTGGLHSLGLKTDGTLWAWGYGWYGQLGTGGRDAQFAPVPVGYDSDWAAIAAGSYHTVALKSNGTLWAWGAGWSGQLGYGSGEYKLEPVQIGAENNWSAVSAGFDHTVALKSNGELWAWGGNGRGQLGDGSGTDQYAPVRVGAATDWATISAGDGYTMALKSDGTLWAWGWNEYGQLGDGTMYDKNVPQQISAGNTWSAAAAGVYHTIALRSDGSLWTWGWNEYGQLGDGTTQDRTVPHYAFAVGDAIVINNGAASTNSTSVTLTLNAWDLTSGVAFMQFSNDGATWSAPEPYVTTKEWMLGSQNGTKTVNAMFQDAAGHWSSVYSSSIFLNSGPTEVSITSPAAGFTQNTTSLLSFTVNKMDAMITVRVDDVAVNKASGDTLDVLSEGTHTIRVEAVDANGLTGSTEVTFTVDVLPPTVMLTSPAAGLTNANTPLLSYTANKQPVTTVVKVDGVVVNKFSGDTLDALADGIHRLKIEVTDAYGCPASAAASFTVDATPPSGTNHVKFQVIDAGGHHAAAIANNGTLWTWGLNTYGQLGDGTKNVRLSPTMIGSDMDWASVSAGDWHTVATKADGSSWAWGFNDQGALGVGDFGGERTFPEQIGTDKHWTALSAGGKHSEAIKSDRTIWAWGSDWEGALGNGGHGNQYVPTWAGTKYLGGHLTGGGVVSAGNNFTLLLLMDGSLWSAGVNDYGQLGDERRICLEERIDFWPIGTDRDWVAISAGGVHAVALKTDGTLWGWGNGTFTPKRMGTDSNWVAISAGPDHTVALKFDGTLWRWGISVTDTPVKIGTDADWAAVSAGSGFTLALKSDGSLWTWGINTDGQLGDGAREFHALPQQVNVVVGSNNPILINGGAGSTGSASVTLSLFAWDGRSGTALMKFRNEESSWTAPEPYATTKQWTLSPDNGLKTVSVMFQDTAGNWSSIYSAQIMLVQGSPSVTITSPVAGITKNAAQLLSYAVSEGSVVVMLDGNAINTSSGATLNALADGEHRVRVEATNSAGTGFAEVVFTVDTVAPVVSLSSPVAGTSKNRTPQLSYTFSDGAVRVRVDGVVVSTVNGDLLNSLSDGVHTVLVQSTDAAGNDGSAQVSFTVDNTPPTITIVSPVAGVTNLSSLPLIYSVSDGAVNVTVDGGNVNVVSGGMLEALSNGSHSVIVSSTDAAGNTGTAQVNFTVDTAVAGNDDTNIYCRGTGTYVVGPSSFTSGISVPTTGNTVLIASPYNGATINGLKTIVKGAMDTTMPVNSVMIVVSNTTGTAGYVAQVNGKYFAAKVPVTTDTYSISAIATDQTGTRHQASVSVSINAQTGSVDLLATPGTGLPLPKERAPASLDVSLTSTATITSPVASYVWDFDGSGSNDLTCYSHPDVIASYQQTGLYLTQVDVTDTAGNKYEDVVIVNVLDRNEMDNIFKPIWSGMKTALSSPDLNLTAVLGYFAESSKESFQQQFTALATALPQYAASLGDINLVNITTNFTEYEFRTVQNGVTYSFQLLFVRDGDGSWKIRSF